MISTFLTRFAVMVTVAWLIFGNTPFTQDTALTVAGLFLLTVVVDVFELLPTGHGTQL